MALKPTIYKFKIMVSDLDQNSYDTQELTVAQHPSETLERMMVRVLAFCLNADEFLTFTKGLSTPDEPDIWSRTLDDQLRLWIDVGEPAVDRIKKATRVAQAVKVYSFNTKSDVWWSQEKDKFANLDAELFQMEWSGVQALAKLVQRTTELSMTITANTAYVAGELGEAEVSWKVLQGV